MTEIMVHSAVGESFSFSESKFTPNESINKSRMVIEDSNELDENTVIFGDKMDSERSSDSTICGSNSKDSVIADDVQNSATRTFKSNTFHKGFEYMTTETTVINAAYDVISQSSVRGIKELPTAVTHQTPTNTTTSDKDKSRVIVQILTSDAKKSVKSPDVVKNKSTSLENQSTHSFRDDVFKILSKSQSSKIDLGNSKEEIKVSSTLKISENFQALSPNGSTQNERSHRKRSLKSYFLFGGGPKISDLEHVSTYLHTATPNALRIVHYVLYDKYGLCNSEMQVTQTRKNILRFCGYPFDQNSQEFSKRANCLKKIPRPILYEVHQAIFGKTSLNSRTLMVQQLMEFFLKPKRYHKIIDKMKRNMQFMLEKEYNNLKEAALKGPLPSVSLQKLEMDDVEKIKNEFKTVSNQDKTLVENGSTLADHKPNYSLPAYILKGPGKKLKYFPTIVRNIENASEKDVNLLHYILYGRIESEAVVCRRNILEFSGFLECQTDFIAELKATLLRLIQADLFELCKILCLRGKTNSRIRRIEKIMEYLQAPFNPIRIRGMRSKEKHFQDTSSQPECIIPEPRGEKYSEVPLVEDQEVKSDGGLRLRDFRKICSNIECSAPSDLTELNDLLFVKPCDETEIHEKILNFTRFGFTESSTNYHYRKTLMFYMGPCIIRKIAKLLDIENWDSQVRSHEDLSSSILNFLMQEKSPSSLQVRSPLSPFPVSPFKSNCTEKPEFQEKSLSPTLQHEADKSIRFQKESVFIHRLSKSSVRSDSCTSTDNAVVPYMDCRNDVVSPKSNFAEEDSIPLRVFIHHPTDQELKQIIHGIIKDNLWRITLGDLVQTVYHSYPKFNLLYRENFIKTEARLMLSELRSDAVNVVQHMSFNQLPM